MRIDITVNGRRHSVDVPAGRLLVELIREDLGLTGTNVGCDTTTCGACTVLLDPPGSAPGAAPTEAVKSCTVLAVQVPDRSVTTVEGLAGADGTPHPVQAAFAAHHGVQCGFCTPGMVLAAVGLLASAEAAGAEDSGGGLDADAVRAGLRGNLCRCTGYQNIVAAVLAAAGADPGTATRPRAQEEPWPVATSSE